MSWVWIRNLRMSRVACRLRRTRSNDCVSRKGLNGTTARVAPRDPPCHWCLLCSQRKLMRKVGNAAVWRWAGPPRAGTGSMVDLSLMHPMLWTGSTCKGPEPASERSRRRIGGKEEEMQPALGWSGSGVESTATLGRKQSARPCSQEKAKTIARRSQTYCIRQCFHPATKRKRR